MPDQHGGGIVWACGAVPSPGRNQNAGCFSAMALFTDLELAVETGLGAKPLTPRRRPCCFSGTQVLSYLKAGGRRQPGDRHRRSRGSWPSCQGESGLLPRVCFARPAVQGQLPGQGQLLSFQILAVAPFLDGSPRALCRRALPPPKRGFWAVTGVAALGPGLPSWASAESPWLGA